MGLGGYFFNLKCKWGLYKRIEKTGLQHEEILRKTRQKKIVETRIMIVYTSIKLKIAARKELGEYFRISQANIT